MYLRIFSGAALCFCLVSCSDAVMIDSFDVGPVSEGPVAELDLLQSGLSVTHVLGGERQWFVLYEGSLNVADADGSLKFSHDSGFFEVANLQYGATNSNGAAQPLNVDLVADGSTQFTIRMAGASAPTDASELPVDVRLMVFSGVGTDDQVGAAVSFKPVISGGEYVVQMPFESFESHLGPIDFSDVDSISVSVLAWEHASFAIDEISTTAGLPGDYNLDGVVNLADYTVWRDALGSSGALPNEDPAATTKGIVDHEDYLFWKSQFGATFPSATANPASAVVPEPSALAMLLSLIVTMIAHCRR